MSGGFRFAIVDASGGASTSDGESMTPDALGACAQILVVYANRDVASEYGGQHLVRAASGPDDVQAGEVPIVIDATLSIAGAIADHSLDGASDPVVEDGITLSDSIMGPGNSVLCALSHEIAETIGDEGCNLVAIDADGTGKAREICDPVETQTYAITVPAASGGMDRIGYVSNFVLRSYFIPGHAGSYDYMTYIGSRAPTRAQPPGPMQPAPSGGGNYQIVYSSVGSASQVMATGLPRARRGRMSARARRRGLTA